MRIVTFRKGGDLHLGVVTETGVADAGQGDLGRLLAAGEEAWEDLARRARHGDRRDLSQLQLGPSVPRHAKLLCVGLNYRRHAEESRMAIPKTPVLFSKFANALAAAGQEIELPGCARQYDYEAELGVVIGRRCREVPESEALDHVFGYCNANDLSARDLQFVTSQWLLGKTLDGFLPVGPHLVTADEVGDPQRLPVRCWMNGEIRQDSSTADMIFSVAEIIAYASRHFTLEPGDLIVTGTPEGVIHGMPGDPESRRWLRAGDEVTVEVGPLGRLTNRLV